MPLRLYDVPLTYVSVDEQRFPDKRDDGVILEHLRRYCSKFYPLPALVAELIGERLVVIRGHKYLQVARSLAHSHIRVVLDVPDAQHAYVRGLPGVRELDWTEANAYKPVARDWHVFFFASSLTAAERDAFEATVVSVFLGEPWSDPHIDVIYVEDGRCAEFQANNPVGHEEWSRRLLSACHEYSSQHVRIVSHQGTAFSG